MGKTAINWTNYTWNPLVGCVQVSPGCARCYAKTLHDMRHQKYLDGDGLWANGKPIAAQYSRSFEVIQLMPERLNDPAKVRKPSLFFVNSVSDLFHQDVPLDYIKRVFEVMNQTTRHTFQVLTKRHERLAEIAAKGELFWTENIWQGVSIENDRFSRRADYLRQVPATVRFISAEPLLGKLESLNLDGIHWLIAGGESGPRYRPVNLDNVRFLRDLCNASGTLFWFKQIGGPKPDSNGRELDGRLWNEMPEPLFERELVTL